MRRMVLLNCLKKPLRNRDGLFYSQEGTYLNKSMIIEGNNPIARFNSIAITATP